MGVVVGGRLKKEGIYVCVCVCVCMCVCVCVCIIHSVVQQKVTQHCKATIIQYFLKISKTLEFF